MTSMPPIPRKPSLPLNTFSAVNKETEDFKQALADALHPPESHPTAADPIFDLIIRLLKESTNPSSADLLNYHYISCGATPEALDYFFSKAKTGDAVARVQLGRLYQEGKLEEASSEVRVVAEAFASQHELAMLKLEGKLKEAEEQATQKTGKVTRVEKTGHQQWDDMIEEVITDLGGEKLEEHRAQPFPIERAEPLTDMTDEQIAARSEELGFKGSTFIPAPDEKDLKKESKKATKKKNKGSKKNAKATKAKE